MWLWTIILVASQVLCQQDDALKPTTPAAELEPPVPAVLEDHASKVLPLSVLPVPIVPAVPPSPQLPPDIDHDSRCFAVWRHVCPPLSETCRCKPIDNESVVCCDIQRPFQLTEGLGCESVKNLTLARIHLWNASLEDLDSLSKRSLASITVSQSHIQRIELYGNTTCVNISGNTIDEIPTDAFTYLPHLQFLSLANLRLPRMPVLKTRVTLDLTGNLSLDCAILLQTMMDYPKIQFINENVTTCITKKVLGWFNATERVSLSQLRMLRDVEEDCVPGCNCVAVMMNLLGDGQNHYGVMVNCSARGLRGLPPKLPPNAVVLDVSNNSISSLDVLLDEATYQQLIYFDASSNQISSILPLEKIITRFRWLSFKQNRISSLPTYIFNSAFDRNVMADVFLGHNKLACNCSVAQTVKIWLVSNRKYIKDYDQIYCSNMPDRVIDLDPNKVCVDDSDWTDYIYLIIAGEVTLLILLVGKVSYDYWVFKTAGYLPWPASKMPKLPCDWVFE